MLQYDELRIRIWKTGIGRYLVFANGAEMAAAVVTMEREPRFYWRQLDELLEEEFRIRKPAADSPTGQRLRELGRELFHVFFPEPIRRCLEMCQRHAGGANCGLRVRFEVDDELANVPFEILCSPAAQALGFAALAPRISIVRSLSGGPVPATRKLTVAELHGPLPLKVVVASPRGRSLDAAREIKKVKAAVPPHLRDDEEQLTIEPPIEILGPDDEQPAIEPSVEVLGLEFNGESATENAIRTFFVNQGNEPCAALLIGHGDYDPERKEVDFVIEDEDGLARPVPADMLAELLDPAGGLRLVVLNLCLGAHSPVGERFAGLAGRLIAAGIPAVVAMQSAVNDRAAAEFSPALFYQIWRNETIDKAVAVGRQAMRAAEDNEWCNPVLFLHQECRHGWLFKVWEAVKGKEPMTDPLRDTTAILRRRLPPLEDFIKVTPFVRRRGDWRRVSRHTEILLADRRTQHPEYKRMALEAQVERRISDFREICSTLSSKDVRGAKSRLKSLQTSISPEVLKVFSLELDEAIELQKQYQDGLRQEKRKSWEKAFQLYELLAAVRPLGYRDVAARRELVRQELAIAEEYEAAETALGKRRWSQAKKLFQSILAERSGYKEAMLGLAYVAGRLAEKARKWEESVAAYQPCVDKQYRDAPKRLHYACGRQAEEQQRWKEALSFYEKLDPKDRDLEKRLPYVRGRLAEEFDDWPAAAAAYEAVEGYSDATERRHYARARVAEEAPDWPGVLEALASLEDDFLDVADRRFNACRRLYDLALKSEEASWSQAAELYRSLPATFEDVEHRRPYALARAAEQDARWAEAVEIFESIATFLDADRRLKYARARVAEEEERWPDAVSAFEDLDATFLDVQDRLAYTRGRVAEADGDWERVIRSFGDLPNEYQEWDVGRRRSLARARLKEKLVAAGEARWTSVVEALREIAEPHRVGEAARLFNYAQARVAEEREDWTEVARICAGLAADYRDVVDRCAYARGRAAEQAGNWSEAVAAYEPLCREDGRLPDGDGHLHWLYSRGRLAEQHKVWTKAVEAFSELPGDYSDAGPRKAHALARRAEHDGRWQDVLDALEPLDSGFPDVAPMRAYARGRLAEQSEAWSDAVSQYGAWLHYRDARERSLHARARECERRGDWSQALEAYSRLSEWDGDLSGRRERLENLREALPWADGLAADGLAIDPYAARVGQLPYTALRVAGITPGSTAEEVRNASFVLMERGAMTPEARLAWDRLRSLRGRLSADAFLYRLAQPARLREVLEDLRPGPPGDLLRTLCQALPDDAPLLLLLDGRSEQAIEAWEARLRRGPQATPTAQVLSVAYFWRARELESSGAYEKAEAAWEQAIAHWARLLSDDAYWADWQRHRAECYGHPVTQNDIARLRSELGQQLLDGLMTYADRYASEGRPERAETYRKLAVDLEVELEGARVLKEVGGLAPPAGEGTLACGVLYLRQCSLGADLGRLVAHLETTEDFGASSDDIPTAIDAALGTEHWQERPATLLRLRCAFSELGRALVLLDRHQPEQAVASLPALFKTRLAELPADCAHRSAEDRGSAADRADGEACAHCREFLRGNPAYLCLPHRRARLLQDAVEVAVRAHLELAQSALVRDREGLDEAVGIWRRAIEISRNASAQVRAKRAVTRTVLGRAEALSQNRGARRGERLSEAIELIELTRPLIGRADRGQLAAKQAEVLTDRGVWYGYGRHEYEDPDYEKAAADLRRALELTPDSLHARDNLSRALIFQAANLQPDGNSRRPFQLFAEAIQVLHDGLGRTAGHRQLRQVLSQALDQLEEWVLIELSPEELTRRIREVGEASPSAGSGEAGEARQLAAMARQKQEGGDALGALMALITAVRRDPADEAVRRSLLEAVCRKAGKSMNRSEQPC